MCAEFLFFWFFLIQIQYSLGPPSGGNPSTMCDFLGVRCKYSVKTCQGIKVCELAGKDITLSTHQEVDMEKDFLTKNAKNNYSISPQQQIMANTQM